MCSSDDYPSARIVITVPSSPDEPPLIRGGVPPETPPSYGPTVDYEAARRMHAASAPSTLERRDASPPAISAFERLVKTTDLPTGGPAYFHARRALWWAPGPHPPQQSEASTSRRRLEQLLDRDGAVESEEVWDAGLGRVWHGLIGGIRLKKRLPLSMVVKIVQAGWVRDGTWPKGGVAPDPDDVLEGDPVEGEADFPSGLSTAATDAQPGVTSLWTPETESPQDERLPMGMGIPDDTGDGRHRTS